MSKLIPSNFKFNGANADVIFIKNIDLRTHYLIKFKFIRHLL